MNYIKCYEEMSNMSAKIPTQIHMCSQEGPISELKANVAMVNTNTNKLESKIDDILVALHKSNEETKVKDTELYSAFKSIEKMLQAEVATRVSMVEGQQKIHENINIISTRVNNIEHDVSNIKTDLSDTKQNIKHNNEVLTKRVSNLERIFGYIYAFGAVVVSITLIIIYGNQLLNIIIPKQQESTTIETNK